MYTSVVTLPSGQLVEISQQVTYGDLILAALNLFLVTVLVGDALYRRLRGII